MNLDVPAPGTPTSSPERPVGRRPPPLRVGSLEIAPPVLLAPMSGLTNLPMRALCEEAGCGLTVTEFLAAPALSAGVKKEVHKVQPSPGGRPWAAQIFGRDPGQMGRAAALCAARGASLVDINMGCPARKVTKGVSGAALMREPGLALELVAAVREAVAGRALVTAKFRSGWDSASINAVPFARMLEQAGVALVAVHARTAKQAYSGKADWDVIAAVRRAVAIPVVGNGDVRSAADAAKMFRHTGCDAVMIGRAALGNPWLFAACRAWWEGRPEPEPPTPADRVAMFLRHLDRYLTIADAPRAVIEMRKFAGWYLRGFPGAAALRRAVYHTADLEGIRALLRDPFPIPGRAGNCKATSTPP